MSSDWGAPAVKVAREAEMLSIRVCGLSAGLEHRFCRRVVPKSSPAEFMASVTPSV